MRNTFCVKFYVRKSKCNKNGEAPLEIAVSINGTRHFLNLPYRVRPEEFAKKRKPKELTEYMELMRSRINQILVEMVQHGEPVTTERLLSFIRTGGYKSYTIEDLFNEYLSVLKKRIGINLSKEVYRKYELVRDSFLQHIDGKRECNTIRQIDILNFYAELEKKFDITTAAGYMTKLKTFITFGMDNNRIEINPFQNVRIKKGNKPITFLTWDDIECILKYNPSTEYMRNIRDCSLFQIATGLSYCDCCEITPEDIREANGVYYISKRRKKTGTEFTAVILPFGMDAFRRGIHYITNQRYNAYLKVMQEQILPNKRLHSHLFRHTYCTLLLNRGVRMEVVSKAAGHSSIKMTESFYAALTQKTIIQEVANTLSI